jgi:hypothetical protein
MIRLLPPDRVGRIRLGAMLAVLVTLAAVFHAQTYFLLTRAPVLYNYFRYAPQEGDVVFQSLPHGDLVDAIEGITHSPYSHCGVVLRNDKGQWVVIESIFNVHETPLFLWMMRGRGAGIAAYRLDEGHAALVPEFKKNLLTYLGDNYDFEYDMSKAQGVYCSDLVYLAFEKTSGEKMGVLAKLGNLDCKPYEHFIQTEQGGKLPLDRVMITPAALASAPQLHEVFRAGL